MSDEKKNNAEVRKAYGKATAALREAHKEEFLALLEAEYAKAGLTVRRRLTAEQRAERDAAKAAEREAKKAAKAAAKIAALEAELAALREQGGDFANALADLVTADA